MSVREEQKMKIYKITKNIGCVHVYEYLVTDSREALSEYIKGLYSFSSICDVSEATPVYTRISTEQTK